LGVATGTPKLIYIAAHNPDKRGFHNFFVLKKYRESGGQRLACGLASFRRELNAFKRLDIDMNIGSEFIVKADGVVANKDAYFFGLVCILLVARVSVLN
jgi:hypothetical protein